MSALAAGFLAGAGSRLLPFSIPFRYFGAAVAFHVVAWLAALAGAASLPSFAGGLGWPLAALHAATLGVLAMTAIGASLQLVPVATRRPVAHAGLAAAIFWVYAPGVAALVAGMGFALPALIGAGALAVAIALVAYLTLFARNLAAARGMPIVVAHAAVAAASLAATLASGAWLAAAYALGAPVDRHLVLPLHLALAGYGFMGMLALGFAYVLVPMFALAQAPDPRRAWASFALACGALVLAVVAAAGPAADVLGVAAAGLGVVSVVLHVQLMREATTRGLRRELGIGFTLVRVAWGALLASLALALALAWGVPVPRLATLFGAALVAGWLLTFVLGILERVVPFLASMHAAAGRRAASSPAAPLGGGPQGALRGDRVPHRRPPTPSSMTAARPLRLHRALHLAALALLAAAIVADSAEVAALAALAGASGAIAYAAFFVNVLGHVRRAGTASPPESSP